MAAFKMLGVSISPLHCKYDEFSELICENGIIKRVHHEVFRGIVTNSRVAAEPRRQHTVDGKPNDAQNPNRTHSHALHRP